MVALEPRTTKDNPTMHELQADRRCRSRQRTLHLFESMCGQANAPEVDADMTSPGTQEFQEKTNSWLFTIEFWNIGTPHLKGVSNLSPRCLWPCERF